MARIRSIHPGQWTDEEFCVCSIAARLLAIALRNEADDSGVFEWKPVGLKMRLMPADPVDINALLAELVETNQISKFVINDRPYGAIRNFRVFQRPKYPKPVHPITDEIRKYVGINASHSPNEDSSGDEISPIDGDEHTDPTGIGEIPPQMEDVVGEEKERTPSGVPKKSRFDEFWAAYPSRGAAANPKAPAQAKFETAVKNGADPDQIILGAVNFARERRASGNDGTEFVMQATKFLNQRVWEGFQVAPRSRAPTLDLGETPF